MLVSMTTRQTLFFPFLITFLSYGFHLPCDILYCQVIGTGRFQQPFEAAYEKGLAQPIEYFQLVFFVHRLSNPKNICLFKLN